MNLIYLRAATAVWTPARLFAASEVGAWYDPSDLSTLWKDTAGTDPVTADGDLVARINDKSGNGKHATQSTSSLRPAYKTSGGLHWLEFDGTDDTIASSSIAFGGATCTHVSGRRDIGTTRFVPYWIDGSTFWGISENSSGLAPGSGSSYEVNTVNVSPFTRGGVFTAVNNKTVVFVAKGLVLPTGPFNLTGFGGHYTQSRYYGEILIDRALTAGEITSAAGYMNGKTGAY